MKKTTTTTWIKFRGHDVHVSNASGKWEYWTKSAVLLTASTADFAEMRRLAGAE